MKSTTRNPRRTGGVVGRGGGSSKPKSWGLNEAILDGLRRGKLSGMGAILGCEPILDRSERENQPAALPLEPLAAVARHDNQRWRGR